DKGDVIENSSNSFIVSFDKSLAGGKIFDLKKGEKAVSLYSANFSQKEKHSVSCRCELCAEDNSVTFKSSDQTEIQYKVLSDRIKENIVVNDKQDSYEYLFLMDIGGLSVEEENGSILLNDIDNGETQFIIPSPYMYDAKQVRSNAVTYEVEADDGQLIIKVIADAAFINAADRAFPVIIDPQIVFNQAEIFKFETVEDQEDSSNYFDNQLMLKYDPDISSFRIWSRLQINGSKVEIDEYVKSVYLELTSMDTAYGQFYFNGTSYLAEPNRKYRLDVTEFVRDNSVWRQIEIHPSWQENTQVSFYTTGENCPKLILEKVENEVKISDSPSIKDFTLGDTAKGYLDLNNGILTTEIIAAEANDFSIPFTICHYHRLGIQDSNFGKNWRLNLNKRLYDYENDTDHTTKYFFQDEAGDNYIFEEKYYIINSNGATKNFITKDDVSIDINGNLTFGNQLVYKHSYCKGYTLIPEVDDFKGINSIITKSNELFEAERALNNYKPTLQNFVVCHLSSALTQKELKDYFVDGRLSENSFNQFMGLISTNPITGDKNILLTFEDKCILRSNIDGSAYNSNIANMYINKSENNVKVLKNLFSDYLKKQAEYDRLLRQTPVNFLQDSNGIYSGFNKEGNLVSVFDAYGNYVSVEYDPFNRIAGVCDNKNKTIAFNYNSDGLLASITDNRGRTVKYNYDQTKLSSIIYADGSSLKFKYSSNRIASIDSDDTQWKMSYMDGKFTRLLVKNLSPVSKTISDTNVTYADKQTTIRYDNDETETYSFDELRYLISHKKTDGAKFNEVTNYSYTKYAGGRTVKTESSSDREYGAVSETVEYDNLDIPVSKTTDWHWISDTVRIKSQTFYSYDIYNKLVKETTTEYIENAGVETQKVYVTNYCYNPQGSLVLTESFIEDEILTSGKNIEEKVYDEKGYLVKTISYNTLDSSSKFYSESEVTESGQLTADKDETGAICAEYEYAAGTNLVNSVTYPNGSKFAYARNYYNDKITSVTQSTEDGEANTTDIVYEHGLPVKVKSGSTAIEYTYDAKGRKATVTVNGKLLSEYGYEDYKKENVDQIYYFKNSHVLHADEANIKFVNQSVGAIDGDYNKMEIRETLTVSGGSFNGTLWSKHYTADGNLNNIAYKSEVEKNVQYEYDSFRRLTQAETKSSGVTEMTESFTYNGFGDVTQKSITGEVNQTYTYAYKNNAARDLDYISFDGYTFKPLTDCYGRNTGKEIYDGESKVAAEYISYRKVGDHATTMPSTVWFATG
ncbi:MAG: hypothetical protein K2N33_03305, partial [Clostridia bacterium]|nr:hypothetical protein [Clostridia bacterium]